MRYLIIAIVGGMILWLLAPKAVPPTGPGQRPQVVVGGSEASDRDALQKAVGAGKLHEDPKRHALRRAVLTAASRAESSPCDTRRRRELSDAFDVYRRHMEATAEDRIETLTLQNGRVIDVSRHFDEPVEDAMRFALTAPCSH
jgi:hypothetical protein